MNWYTIININLILAYNIVWSIMFPDQNVPVQSGDKIFCSVNYFFPGQFYWWTLFWSSMYIFPLRIKFLGYMEPKIYCIELPQEEVFLSCRNCWNVVTEILQQKTMMVNALFISLPSLVILMYLVSDNWDSKLIPNSLIKIKIMKLSKSHFFYHFKISSSSMVRVQTLQIRPVILHCM